MRHQCIITQRAKLVILLYMATKPVAVPGYLLGKKSEQHFWVIPIHWTNMGVSALWSTLCCLFICRICFLQLGLRISDLSLFWVISREKMHNQHGRKHLSCKHRTNTLSCCFSGSFGTLQQTPKSEQSLLAINILKKRLSDLSSFCLL